MFKAKVPPKVMPRNNIAEQWAGKIEQRAQVRQDFDAFLRDKRGFGDHPTMIGHGLELRAP